MNPYTYPVVEPGFNLRLTETTRSWLRYSASFPIAKPLAYYDGGNTGRGEFFRPRQKTAGPLAILVHGWGDQSVIPFKMLARDLARRGIASFILYLIFHHSRMPKAMQDKGLHLTPEEWFEGYQTSVIDVRQVVDWASSQDEIEKEQIAVIGLSLGGIIAAISMAVERRIGSGVFLVTGGNYESRAWSKRRRDGRNESDLAEDQEHYARYLAEVAEKGLEEANPSKQSYLTDPVTFGSYLSNRPVMMINALWDEIIARQAALDFWQACGKPAIRWLPATHASIWLLYPLIRRQIVGFLGDTFHL